MSRPYHRFALRLILSIVVCCLPLFSYGQCANNNVLTGAAVTPTCTGSTTVPCVQGGQYALVNVVAGNVYTFSTCGATFDTQITLYNNSGGGSLGYNDDFCGLQSTVNWVANFTGQLRVLVDLYDCANTGTCAPLVIACSGPPIGSDCVYVLTLNDSFGDGWGTSYVGVSINGGPYTNYSVATVTNQVIIGVSIGDIITLNYNNSGAFQGDNSYTLSLLGSTLFSSGTPPAAGVVYASTVTCVPPPPPQEDCLGAVTICSNVALSNNTTNTGNVADINASNSGCLDITEYQGTWYTFSPSVGGDLGMTISPLGPDDYDWAVWGPYPPGTAPSAICPPVGPPIRCAASSGPATNASTGSYATGMGHATFSPPRFAPVGTSYGIPSTFDNCPLVPPQRCGWVPGMQVSVGQVFLMYISNWSQSSTGFNLSWTLENGASLDCTVLPVSLTQFSATALYANVLLEWTTTSELGSDHFVVERGQDGVHFHTIGVVQAAGHSNSTNRYQSIDPAPAVGLNYYRLRQVDADAKEQLSDVRTVTFLPDLHGLVAIPNPGSGFVEIKVPEMEPGARLNVMDVTGRVVLHPQWHDGRTGFDATDLPNGAYLLQVTTASGVPIAHGRWVKN
ncbi:MAG: T9SS type A sorting domain-containing protein [Flavobacteriales bacterium]